MNDLPPPVMGDLVILPPTEPEIPSGPPSPTLCGVCEVLGEEEEWAGRIWRDDYRDKTMIKIGGRTREVQDVDELAIVLYLEKKRGVVVTPMLVHNAIELVAEEKKRDPLLNWLNGLVWDGVSRLNTVARLGLGTTAPGADAIVARWILSAVARAYAPGCQADGVLLLAGEQGKNKSKFLRTLVGDSWFSDNPLQIGSRDTMDMLARAWIHEMAELDSVRRRESSAVKAFISCRVDHSRKSYGRNVRERPRRCIFAGTTNEEGFLTDPTGSRRWWVVEPGEIDIPWVVGFRDQIWAEAITLYHGGERWWFEGQEERWMNEENINHGEEDVWAHAIVRFLLAQQEKPAQDQAFTVSQVLTEVVEMGLDRQDQRALDRVTRILQNAGCPPSAQRRVRGVKARWWTPPSSPVSPLPAEQAEG